MSVDNEFTNYKRHPIWINPHAIALLQIFKLKDNFNDVWLLDNVPYMDHIHADMHKEAAEQFLKQLEGQECAAFLIALKKEITKRLMEYDLRNKGKTNWNEESNKV